MDEPRLLDVVWIGGLGTWEGPWIDEILLEKIPHRNFVYPELPEHDSPSILLVFRAGLREPDMTVVQLLDIYSNAKIIILSDEKLRHNSKLYGKARAIVRQYYSPFLAWDLRTHAIPLGFNSAIGQKTGSEPSNENSPRLFPWAFFGQVKNIARREMLLEFANLTDEFGAAPTHFTSSFAATNAISGGEIAKLFDQTYFVPAPMGNRNPDTFRVMEALERGAIPVVVRFYGLDFFRLTFGKHPFVVGRNWRDAANRCRELLEDSKLMAAKSHEVRVWYRDFTQELQAEIHKILSDTQRSSAIPSQRYSRQVLQSFNPYVVVIFWVHFRWPEARRRLYSWVDRLRGV